jgi:hypothetical protein
MTTLFFSIWSGRIITSRIMSFRVLERIAEETRGNVVLYAIPGRKTVRLRVQASNISLTEPANT